MSESTTAIEPASGPVIVAIDGPSGVGKSTVARRLARELHLPYLDTGAMYRAVALQVIEAGVSPDDEEAVTAIARRGDLTLAMDTSSGGASVLVDGGPVEERIRSPQIEDASSRVSAYPGVREMLVALQRSFALRHGGVLEGRDIGTRVFPDAPHKFFLDARQDVRYRRRFEQLKQAGYDVTYSEVVVEIDRRDQRDSHRSESPLTYNESYTLVDTSDLTLDNVVEQIILHLPRETHNGAV